MTESSDTSDTAHETRGAAPVSLTPTTETSWAVTTETGNLVLGQITQDGGTFTAYDAQELRIGNYPTRDEALDAIITGTP